MVKEVRDPNMFYPDDPDYPTGGPHAIYKDIFPRPGRSPANPEYKEGDAPAGIASPEERALFEQFTQGSPEAKEAARAQIVAIVGADSGPAFAQWLAKASGHQ